MTRTLLKTEQVPGQNRELRTYSDGTSEAVDMPTGYYPSSTSNSPYSSYQKDAQGNYIDPNTGVHFYESNGQLTNTSGGGRYIPENNSNTTPTPKVIYNSDGTRSVIDNLMNDNAPESKIAYEARIQTTKDERAKMLQDRIDAINNMYTGIISKANESGNDRLGSGNVINAIAGQRGSASGARNIDNINQYNDEIQKNILAEKQNKINSIIDTNFKDQTAELQKERELRQTNLDQYVAYMAQKEQTNITKSQKMRADLISGGIKLEDINNESLQKMADSAGYTVDQFKALYQAELDSKKSQFIKDEQKRLADLAKTTAETAKLTAEANPVQKQLLAKGYTPITNPNDLKNLTENDIIRIGTDIYRKPLSENLGAKVLLKKTTSKTSGPVKTKNYTSTTIPANIKGELLSDVTSGKFTKQQVYSAYPEVDTKYIDSLMK